MPKRVRLREVSEEEKQEVIRLAHSRTAAARLVQRAKVIEAMIDDPSLSAAQAGCRFGYRSRQAGKRCVRAFNAKGVKGFDDEPRSGRPRTHSQEVRSALVSLAVQKPNTLGMPFSLWTLERLQIAFKEREGVHLSDSTIWEWLAEEGLKWKRQQSWFHEAEKHDPEFVEKRGP